MQTVILRAQCFDLFAQTAYLNSLAQHRRDRNQRTDEYSQAEAGSNHRGKRRIDAPQKEYDAYCHGVLNREHDNQKNNDERDNQL